MLSKEWTNRKNVLPNPRKWDSDRLLLLAGENQNISFPNGGGVHSSLYQYENHSSALLTSSNQADIRAQLGVSVDLSNKKVVEFIMWIDDPDNIGEVMGYCYNNIAVNKYAYFAMQNLLKNSSGSLSGYRSLCG